jgi:hypothetical protein
MPSARLIFWGGSREVNNDGRPTDNGARDNSAFQFAANNGAKDYGDWGKTGKKHKIRCANNMVALINAMAAGSLASLDILSHGTPVSLNFSVRDDLNCGLFASRTAKTGFGIVGPFRDDVNSPDNECAVVTDINFRVFTDDAIIELHGCQTAGNAYGLDSIAVNLSQGLSGAGKKKAVVIAHLDKANPNIGGTQNVLKQDYRHGRRVIIYNGKIVHEFTRTGRIKPSDVEKYLK